MPYPHDRAGPLLDRALAVRREAFGPEHLDVAESLDALGSLKRRTGDFASAVPLLEEALAIHRRLAGARSLEAAGSVNSMGIVMRQMGDLDGRNRCIARRWPSGANCSARRNPGF